MSMRMRWKRKKTRALCRKSGTCYSVDTNYKHPDNFGPVSWLGPKVANVTSLSGMERVRRVAPGNACLVHTFQRARANVAGFIAAEIVAPLKEATKPYKT